MIRRPLLASLTVTLMCVGAPVFAQHEPVPAIHGKTIACKNEMSKYEPEVAAMADKTKKAAAMREMRMAKESLGKHDEKICMTHVNKVMEMMH